jgi:hypothetical protein
MLRSQNSNLTAVTFIKNFAKVALGLIATISFTIWLLDPYGASPIGLPTARPIMDINQRYMYPQVARSRLYNSVVIGTSTSRLLDPDELNKAFGGRFANLAMNAATAWEQIELAKLYLRYQPAPKTFILGLDQMWCADDKTLVKITFRGFPAWMYDNNPWNDLVEMVNLKTLEITGRLIGFHLGFMPERIRSDGYEVFTPPEVTYDLARARIHIWRDNTSGKITPVVPAVVLTSTELNDTVWPAMQWLDNILEAIPKTTTRIVGFMPLHIASQPIAGSRTDAYYNACKARIAGIAHKHGLRLVDFSIPSEITRDDANYWDPLHYRLPIAGRIIRSLKAAVEDGLDAADGTYKVWK